MIDFNDGHGVVIFFGNHSCPLDSLHGEIEVGCAC